MPAIYQSQNQQKIVLLSCGGTIGSGLQANGNLDVNLNLPASLLQVIAQHQNQYKSAIIVEQFEPFLSENATASTWLAIAEAVTAAKQKHQPAAIIITHGSDSFAYTAAALSLLLATINIPLIITAASIAPELPNSDAPINLRASLQMAAANLPANCYALYQKPKKNKNYVASIYASCQIEPIRSYRHNFTQIGGGSLGTVCRDKIKLKKFTNPQLKLNSSTIADIKIIHAYPNQTSKSLIAACAHARAVLLNLYHSGSACVQAGAYSYIEFLEFCNSKNIAVFGMPFLSELHYQSTSELLTAGLIALPIMSLPAAYVKLCLLAATCNNQVLTNQMHTNYCGEILENIKL